MALNPRNVTSRPFVSERKTATKSRGPVNLFCKSKQHCDVYTPHQGIEYVQRNDHHLTAKYSLSNKCLWYRCQSPGCYIVTRGSTVQCWSNGTHNVEAKKSSRNHNDPSDLTGGSSNEEDGHQSIQGFTDACRFVYNDAKFVNERARHDIFLLSRGIMRMDARARQDVAVLGLEFLKLDARAREDTEKIDRDVKEKAEHLHRIATIFRNRAESKLRKVADKHWSDGALEADLRRADFRAKQRAMEDAFMALKFVKSIHDRMVDKVFMLKNASLTSDDAKGRIMLEKNGKSQEFFPIDVSSDRIAAIQEAYLSMATALSEADGIDYTNPEELELLVSTLIDLDAMDGKSSVSLLVECSRSADVSTRKALANALATAPSMWTLGNAGMGALQRLSEDSNPAIAAAASKAINELREQWEIEEGDSFRFTVRPGEIQKPDV